MEVSDEGLSRDLLYIEMNSLYRDELTAHKQHTPIYILKTQVVPHQVLIHGLMIKFYLAFSVNKGKGKKKKCLSISKSLWALRQEETFLL